MAACTACGGTALEEEDGETMCMECGEVQEAAAEADEAEFCFKVHSRAPAHMRAA